MNESNVIVKIAGEEGLFASAAVSSILGNRNYQQDFAAIVQDSSALLAVICDGMGGMNGGEIASEGATRLILKNYQELFKGVGIPEFLQRCGVQMDQMVADLKTPEGEPLHAGSTVVAVVILDGKLYWMSVGDSRIYVLRGDTMVPVTRDHNYRRELEDMLEMGSIDQNYFDQESKSRKAEALTSYLGMGGLRRMERNTAPFVLEAGDLILLCSDGVYKSLEHEQMQAMLEDNRVDTQVSARRLVKMALTQAKKKQDNTTAVVIEYYGDEEDKTDGPLL